jgi:hypothetical protein
MDKPGIKTTEFWSTAFVHLITASVVISALMGKNFDGGKLQPLVPIAAFFASAIAQAFYSHSRKDVKTAALQALAQVNTPAPSVVSHGTTHVHPNQAPHEEEGLL